MLHLSKSELWSWATSSDWFKKLETTPQDKLWHAEGNVSIHTEMVFNAYKNSSDTIGLIACLLHDVAKPFTTREENGRVVSPGHTRKGSQLAQTILWGLLPVKERILVTELVRMHGQPLFNWYGEKALINTSVMQSTVSLKQLSDLVEADITGRICLEPGDDILERFELWKELCLTIPPSFLDSETGIRAYNKQLDILPTAPINYSRNDSKVIFVCGLPGSGKDNFIKNNLSQYPVISLDDLRRKNKIKRNDSKGQGHIIQEAQEELRQHLRNKEDCILNLTNITKQLRGKWIKLSRDYNAYTVCHYIEPTKDTLLYQNKNREFPIPEKELIKLFNSLEVPHPLEMNEVSYHID